MAPWRGGRCVSGRSAAVKWPSVIWEALVLGTQPQTRGAVFLHSFRTGRGGAERHSRTARVRPA